MNEENRKPMIGDKFPETLVKTTHGMINIPDDYKGRWIVLFSHPGDFTPVCTTEFISFSEKAAAFDKLGASLIGLSVDQVFSHIKWTEWIKEKFNVEVPFPIIADELGIMAQQLGMVHPAKGTNTVRAVYIIDDKGVIRLQLMYPQEAGRNIDEILRILEALQTADKNKCAMPADWPSNHHLGRKVLVPPANNMDAIANRQKEIEKGDVESKDWWFCYREL